MSRPGMDSNAPRWANGQARRRKWTCQGMGSLDSSDSLSMSHVGWSQSWSKIIRDISNTSHHLQHVTIVGWSAKTIRLSARNMWLSQLLCLAENSRYVEILGVEMRWAFGSLGRNSLKSWRRLWVSTRLGGSEGCGALELRGRWPKFS